MCAHLSLYAVCAHLSLYAVCAPESVGTVRSTICVYTPASVDTVRSTICVYTPASVDTVWSTICVYTPASVDTVRSTICVYTPVSSHTHTSTCAHSCFLTHTPEYVCTGRTTLSLPAEKLFFLALSCYFSALQERLKPAFSAPLRPSASGERSIMGKGRSLPAGQRRRNRLPVTHPDQRKSEGENRVKLTRRGFSSPARAPPRHRG